MTTFVRLFWFYYSLSQFEPRQTTNRNNKIEKKKQATFVENVAGVRK